MNPSPRDAPPKIAYVTAGAAGMFCGSCMHDNTLVRALLGEGLDVELIPTYTPIRTDEEDVSVDRVFFGGINVYLQQKLPFLRFLPAALDRWFDNPRLLRWVSSRAMDVSPNELGALAVSMLKGRSGSQRKEVGRLCQWLSRSSRPDLIVLSNILIGGFVPAVKERLGIPVLVTLQGDDIFLDQLPDRFQQAAVEEIRKLVPHVDGFIVNSRFYGESMGQRFSIPPEKLHSLPLGIDTTGFPDSGSLRVDRSPPAAHRAIGYMARLAPEKGLHLLVDAFLRLKKDSEFDDVQLWIAGWLGKHNRSYAEEQFDKMRETELGDDFQYLGEVDREQKIQFLRSIDLLSVPTIYKEPKGLFVLEALAAGVPVVQPSHGSFPELLDSIPGGRLVCPEDPQHLADVLAELLRNHSERARLARRGHEIVHQQHNATAMARATINVYRKFLNNPCWRPADRT